MLQFVLLWFGISSFELALSQWCWVLLSMLYITSGHAGLAKVSCTISFCCKESLISYWFFWVCTALDFGGLLNIALVPLRYWKASPWVFTAESLRFDFVFVWLGLLTCGSTEVPGFHNCSVRIVVVSQWFLFADIAFCLWRSLGRGKWLGVVCSWANKIRSLCPIVETWGLFKWQAPASRVQFWCP